MHWNINLVGVFVDWTPWCSPLMDWVCSTYVFKHARNGNWPCDFVKTWCVLPLLVTVYVGGEVWGVGVWGCGSGGSIVCIAHRVAASLYSTQTNAKTLHVDYCELHIVDTIDFRLVVHKTQYWNMKWPIAFGKLGSFAECDWSIWNSMLRFGQPTWYLQYIDILGSG